MAHRGRQLSHEVLEAYRFRAIALWKKGKKINEIADIFEVHRVTVSDWISLYRKKGKAALKSKKAPGARPKLSGRDRKLLFTLLRKDALHYGFDNPLWTCRRVQQMLTTRMLKKLDTVTVWRLLLSIGLTRQAPERRALQENPREAKRWLREEWPKILAHRRRWQAMLYFQDESGVSLIPVVGKTWSPKGKTPIVRVTNARGGFCVSSAVSPAGRMVFRIEKERVNAVTFIDFLTQILGQHPHRKVIIVTDQARPHISNLVKGFVMSNQNKLVLYYLPPHSPHLNPDEKVWRHLKSQKLKAHQAKTKNELKPVLVSSMRSIQKSRSLIGSFFMNTYVV